MKNLINIFLAAMLSTFVGVAGAKDIGQSLFPLLPVQNTASASYDQMNPLTQIARILKKLYFQICARRRITIYDRDTGEILEVIDPKTKKIVARFEEYPVNVNKKNGIFEIPVIFAYLPSSNFELYDGIGINALFGSRGEDMKKVFNTIKQQDPQNLFKTIFLEAVKKKPVQVKIIIKKDFPIIINCSIEHDSKVQYLLDHRTELMQVEKPFPFIEIKKYLYMLKYKDSSRMPRFRDLPFDKEKIYLDLEAVPINGFVITLIEESLLLLKNTNKKIYEELPSKIPAKSDKTKQVNKTIAQETDHQPEMSSQKTTFEDIAQPEILQNITSFFIDTKVIATDINISNKISFLRRDLRFSTKGRFSIPKIAGFQLYYKLNDVSEKNELAFNQPMFAKGPNGKDYRLLFGPKMAETLSSFPAPDENGNVHLLITLAEIKPTPESE